MPSQIQVRSASPKDILAIATIHVEAWRKAYSGLIPQKYLDQLNISERQALWEKRVTSSQSDQKIFVLEKENRVVGFSSFGASRELSEKGEIYALYISHHYWRQGLGQQLLTASEEALKEDCYQEAVLWVLSNNQRALHFYKQAGWYPEKFFRHDTILGVPVHEVRYRTRLIFKK